MKIQPLHPGSCHCGSVQFEVDLPNGLEDLRRCNCSMCRRRGAVVASISLGALRITRGEDVLSLYEFNTNVAKHYFCSRCGIYTHHLRRSNPDQYAVNIACLDGVNPYDVGDVQVMDGINHPADK